mgnify:CR=1 FL=1
MKNRIISLILVLVLVFTLLPVYAIADANAETEPKDDEGMTLEQSPNIQALVDQIRKLLNGEQDSEQLKTQLQELLKGLDSKDFQKLLEQLGVKDAEEFMKMLKDLLNNNGSIDPDLLKTLLGMFIKDKDILDQLLNGLTQEQLQELLQKLLDGNFKLEDLKGLLTEENLQKLLDELKKNKDFNNLFGDIDIDKLIEALKGLFDGEDNGFNSDIVAQLLQELLKKLGDGELKELLGKLNIDELKKLIEDLLDKNGDIGDILGKLDKDKLLELFKQFIGDNETLKKLLEKLDSDQIADILKKLLEGGFDIKDLLKNLDAYTFLKFIAGLIGSELDVTGPNDVTVKEGESATFKVKVNTAGTYKYLWLEPDAVKSIDFGGIDLSGSNKLEIVLKLLAALKKVSLSTTDTLTIAKAAASDNGRAFACMIYNTDLKSPTMYITNEAKLTVAAHEHTKVIDTPAVAATCTKDGCTEGSHCSECGEVLSKSEVIPATGHKLVYKVCSVCGYEVPFPFVDVSKTDWFYNDVKYVWQHDIMNGVSDTKFAPETPMTRAMFVTVLYRLEGSPDVTGMATPPFTDIGAKNFDWAYNAIVWAYNTGVTKGTSATTFAPGVAISRQEIVTMFYRYAGSPAVSGSPIFGDSSVISSWARDAVQWAKSFGVVNGYPNGNFGPVDATTRGQMAAMIHRYMQLTNVL